ncbi:MAG: AsnC family transcriptional regulator [Bacillota bacterium]
MASWSFLTNHGLALTYIGRYPDSTGLAIAQAVGITERAARKIVADLLTEHYIQREKVGRRNRYRLNTSLPLKHPVERTVTVGELLGLLQRNHDRAGCDCGGEDPPIAQDEDMAEGAAGPVPRP